MPPDARERPLRTAAPDKAHFTEPAGTLAQGCDSEAVRCDKAPCVDVIAFLEAADLAVQIGYPPDHPAIIKMRVNAATNAKAHNYGVKS